MEIIYYLRVIWLIYLVLSAYVIYMNRMNKIWLQNKLWVSSVFLSIFTVWLAYWTSNYTSYIVGALTFTILIYFLFLVIFMRMKPTKRKTRKSTNFIKPDDPFYLKLNETLLAENLFTNPDLTMPNLAKRMNVSPHFLSEFLNDTLETNFSKFINHYRIEEAIRLLKSESNYSMDAIAFDCGFNSVSTFYTAFKSITDLTPAKFKESL